MARSLRQVRRPARADAVRIALGRTLADWRRNGNTARLTEMYVEDPRSFVALSSWLTSDRLEADELAIYRATLAALVDGWLAR